MTPEEHVYVRFVIAVLGVTSLALPGTTLGADLPGDGFFQVLEREPEYLFEIIDAPAQSFKGRAVRAFLATPEGMETWLTRRLTPDRRKVYAQDVEELVGLDEVAVIPVLLTTIEIERRRDFEEDRKIRSRSDIICILPVYPPRWQTLEGILERIITKAPLGASPVILEVLHCGEKTERRLLARIVSRIDVPDPALLHFLSIALGDADGFVGSSAHMGLVKAGSIAIPVFIDALRDSDPRVRGAAAAGLGWILRSRPNPITVKASTRDTALEALTAVLSDENAEVLQKACEALRRIGHGTEKTITALRTLLAHEEQRVRFTADHALSEITGIEYLPGAGGNE